MIKTIFLDIDDVLNAFTMHSLKYIGCDVEPLDYHKYDPTWGWDIVKAVNALHTERWTANCFWDAMDQQVWATAPKSQECDWLLEVSASLVGKENVCLLSSMSLRPEVAAGKAIWVKKMLPKWIHRQFFFGPPKEMCARPDALLIDDNDDNIKRFRAAGGCGVLVPRPWNSMNGRATRSYLNGAMLCVRADIRGTQDIRRFYD